MRRKRADLSSAEPKFLVQCFSTSQIFVLKIEPFSEIHKMDIFMLRTIQITLNILKFLFILSPVIREIDRF